MATTYEIGFCKLIQFEKPWSPTVYTIVQGRDLLRFTASNHASATLCTSQLFRRMQRLRPGRARVGSCGCLRGAGRCRRNIEVGYDAPRNGKCMLLALCQVVCHPRGAAVQLRATKVLCTDILPSGRLHTSFNHTLAIPC